MLSRPNNTHVHSTDLDSMNLKFIDDTPSLIGRLPATIAHGFLMFVDNQSTCSYSDNDNDSDSENSTDNSNDADSETCTESNDSSENSDSDSENNSENETCTENSNSSEPSNTDINNSESTISHFSNEITTSSSNPTSITLILKLIRYFRDRQKLSTFTALDKTKKQLQTINSELALKVFEAAIKSQRENNMVFLLGIQSFKDKLTEAVKNFITPKPSAVETLFKCAVSNHSRCGLRFLFGFPAIRMTLECSRPAYKQSIEALIKRKVITGEIVTTTREIFYKNKKRLRLFKTPENNKKQKTSSAESKAEQSRKTFP
jgi:hypothetical protein